MIDTSGSQSVVLTCLGMHILCPPRNSAGGSNNPHFSKFENH